MDDVSISETDWTRHLQRGEAPDPDSLRQHLRAVHSRHAGFTESCAALCRDGEGRNSYELLATLVDPARHRDVLDLACGSGVLLDLCHRRNPGALSLTGVDMSAEELALARRRLARDASATLHEGLAQDMAFLPDAGMDLVLCHWALTLMDPVGPVLREASRVLRPGGTFAAVVDGDMEAADGYADVHHLIYGHVQREVPGYGVVDMGDPRIRRTGALSALAAEAFGGADVRIEPFVLTLQAEPEVLAREAAGFFYAAFVLPAESHAAMLGDLTRFFAAQSGTRPPQFSMPVNRLVVHQPQHRAAA